MPAILKIENKDGQRTAVWDIKEDEFSLLEKASLSKNSLDALSLITNQGRRLEWLAVRALLNELYTSAPIIDYDENGKPVLLNHSDKISISHSANMVVIALNSRHNPGIDIEGISPRIYKIASRFIGETERTALATTQPSAEQLTIIWGAKEVMFKVYGKGEVSFKNDFEVKPFVLSTKGTLKGIIYKEENIIVPMEYLNIENFILVQTNYSY